jgi:hypothetical protein
VIEHFLAAYDPAEVFRRAYRVEPLDWQLAYLREFRPVILLKGRQVGASLAAAALAIHQALYSPDSNAVIVSPTLRQSTEITSRARAGLRNLDEPLAQDSASLLRLRNGSRILSLPGTPTSVRGWSAQLLILDEAAYIEPATYTAARALVATGGRLVVQSTPAGENGDFYELWQANDPAWAHLSVRSDQVPTISPTFLAQERRAMSPDAFASEYECAFGRAGGAGAFFSAERIASLVLPSPEHEVVS